MRMLILPFLFLFTGCAADFALVYDDDGNLQEIRLRTGEVMKVTPITTSPEDTQQASPVPSGDDEYDGWLATAATFGGQAKWERARIANIRAAHRAADLRDGDGTTRDPQPTGGTAADDVRRNARDALKELE